MLRFDAISEFILSSTSNSSLCGSEVLLFSELMKILSFINDNIYIDLIVCLISLSNFCEVFLVFI